MAEEEILVVGGYGAVGRVTSAYLARRHPGRVFAAGRSRGKAEDLSRETDGAVRPLRFDMNDERMVREHLPRFRTVVVCVERTDDRFVRACLERGVRYTEVAASMERQREILDLHALAVDRGTAADAGVGLAPGLSNLMAAHLARRVGNAENVEVAVLLGLGEEHGKDAIRWMLEAATEKFEPAGEQLGPVEPLTDPRRVRFPGDRMPRRTYRFNFADQHALAESLPARAASTRVCFDSRPITWLVALGRRWVGQAKGLTPGRLMALSRHLRRMRLASDRFAVHVTVEHGENSATGWAVGRGEAHATGIVTGIAAGFLHGGAYPAGAHHTEEVLELRSFRDDLETEGIHLSVGPGGAEAGHWTGGNGDKADPVRHRREHG